MNARMLDQNTPPVEAVAEGPDELGALLRNKSARGATDPAAMCLGRIRALRSDGVIEVEFPGSGGPLAARLAAPVSGQQLQAALQSAQQIVLAFENGDITRPIIIGLIAPAPDLSAPTAEPPRVVEADVDGKRVRIVAQDEIVLECGEASVTLRRNGRIVIRGTYVETASEGTNRIKGGQVRIN
jgi:hypothetical protein